MAFSGFATPVSQTIYPTVVTTDDLFQYGECEGAALYHYLNVASDVTCESGCWERGGCQTEKSGGATLQGFQHS